MPSHTLRAVPVPPTASPEVQSSFRLLSQNTNQQNQELTQVLKDSGADSATLAPTNAPTNTTFTIVTNEDASMDVILTWDYVQGLLPAENFVLFWNEGPSPLPPLTVDSNAVMVGADANAFRFEGLNPNNNYRFGIAAGRRPTATSGMVVGTIVQPDSGPVDWSDIHFGNPDYVGTVWGMEQHNFVVDSSGTSATNTTVSVQKDGVVLWSPGIAAHTFNVLVYDLTTKLVVSQTTYDVQGNPAAATTMANDLNALTGGKLIIIFSAGNPGTANRLGGGLPAAIAVIGGNRTVFSSDSFQTGSAYVLVGKPLLGEGNGLEQYVGKTANATDAHVTLTFQTQDDQLVALSGTGWQQSHTPGKPTNNPTALALTNTTVDTGNRVHKLTWGYTQPPLSGDNKLADGFILYYGNGDQPNPALVIEQQVKLDVATRAHTFEWSLVPGSLVSYATATYRKTTSGVEVGTPVNTGSWHGVAADRVVSNKGIGPGEVQGNDPTNPPGTVDNLGNGQVTSDKRMDQKFRTFTWTGIDAVPPGLKAVGFAHGLGKIPSHAFNIVSRTGLLIFLEVTGVDNTNIIVSANNISAATLDITFTIYYW
jgi:hypothetical protein